MALLFTELVIPSSNNSCIFDKTIGFTWLEMKDQLMEYYIFISVVIAVGERFRVGRGMEKFELRAEWRHIAEEKYYTRLQSTRGITSGRTPSTALYSPDYDLSCDCAKEGNVEETL